MPHRSKSSGHLFAGTQPLGPVGWHPAERTLMEGGAGLGDGMDLRVNQAVRKSVGDSRKAG